MAQLQRERGGAPLFETAFNFTHFHVYQLLRQVEGVEILGGTASDQMYFPLTIQFNLDLAKPRLIAALDCDGNDMTAAQVQWALELYLRVLGAMAEGPDRRHGGLDFLSAAERHQVLAEWNDTGWGGRSEFVPVHERLAERAAAAPGTLAVAGAAGRLTYGELYERAGRLALRLNRSLSLRRVGEGEPIVGILIERSPDLIVALAGTLLSGAAYLPLDPAYPRERLAYMLEDSGARVLLTAGRTGDLVPPGFGGEVIDLSEPGALAESGRLTSAAVSAERLAYVIYTSGSTGRPKGVEVSHGGLANLVGWHRAAYGVTPLDRATQLAGTGFDASVWEVWPYLAAGASLHLPDESTRLSPAALLGWLAREAVTLSFLPTALAEGVLAGIAGGGVPPGLALRALLTGGDRLHRPAVVSLPFRLVNHYGPTESTVVATCAEVDLDEPADLAPPIGRPIAELRVRLLDRAGLPVAAGVAGELYVGGASLARGYRGRPDLTAERFVPDPLGEEPGARLYRTGDLARHRPDGALDFLGRADAQVKVRGVRIELGEIEQGLLAHPAVREAAALARQDEPGGETRLVGYVVLTEEASAEPEAILADLRRHLRESLPEAMVPAAFVPLAALPLTANGKLDRVALPAPERTRRVTDSAYMPPRDPVEQGLAEIWAEVLRLERVGVQDDFFALGGHSLLATQLISRVRERFEVEVPITALFDHPTVEGLAVVVEELRLEQEDGEDLARMLEELDGLSDEEARERLSGGARVAP
jgi:amino acid adenylation domain-containing protein